MTTDNRTFKDGASVAEAIDSADEDFELASFIASIPIDTRPLSELIVREDAHQVKVTSPDGSWYTARMEELT